MAEKHEWNYCSLGGVTRVMINSGEDIAHLGELDQKLWTVLSCPVDGLEFDKETLQLLDRDKDGKIRVAEVVETASYLTRVIKNNDLLLKGESLLPFSEINTEDVDGAKLVASARQILKNLGVEGEEITLAQASDSTAIFAGTKFNGDGIITPLSTDDADLKATIADIIGCSDPLIDRSGEAGVNAEAIEAFYAACADYSKWKSSEGDKAIFPYGTDTQAVLDLVGKLKAKVADFFIRCKLVKYDEKIAQDVTIAVTSIDEIGNCPIAQPNSKGKLDPDAINPVWQPLVSQLVALVPALKEKDSLDESEWSALCSSMDGYVAWTGAKAGAAVEPLGIERVNAILAAGLKDQLLALVDQDKALEGESNAIDDVKRLMLLYKNFYSFLRNYVTLFDFYAREPRASFEVGKLYIDQRCCDLCIRVADMGQHADMAKLSGMFLIYCKCTSVKKGKTMDIVAVMTDGDTSDLRPGKNGVFYDNEGGDWDAVVTKVVDNPLSIKQAFWAPYKKFWDFCVGLINKSAADKDKKMTENLQAKATSASANVSAAAANPAAGEVAPKPAKAPFDIAKFAGIFAAIGLALGAIGSFLTGIANGVKENPMGLVYAVLAIIIIISAPSCFIAWSKLRKRNLGPVLNANGWAVNSKVLVNILFGRKLTSVAKYPLVRKGQDPYARKKCGFWCWFLIIVLVLVAAVAALQYFEVIDILQLFKKGV